MAQINSNSENVGVVNSWTLIAFAKEFGKMQVGEFVNHESADVFKSCIFTHPTKKDEKGNPLKTFVNFARKLGVLTPKEIVAQKDELQVVLLTSGKYKLCQTGSNTWEDVDLF